MKSYVEAQVRQGQRIPYEVFAREYFAAQPEDLRSRLIERVSGIVAALNDANHVAYGVSRQTFDAYQALPAG